MITMTLTRKTKNFAIYHEEGEDKFNKLYVPLETLPDPLPAKIAVDIVAVHGALQPAIVK